MVVVVDLFLGLRCRYEKLRQERVDKILDESRVAMKSLHMRGRFGSWVRVRVPKRGLQWRVTPSCDVRTP